MSISRAPLVISIDSQGEYFINLGEEQLPISLVELKNKAKIIYLANPDIEIVFKSDAKVPFDYVAKGMASIQSLGIQQIQNHFQSFGDILLILANQFIDGRRKFRRRMRWSFSECKLKVHLYMSDPASYPELVSVAVQRSNKVK